MSMIHKAYEFDWEIFSTELLDIIEVAFKQQKITAIEEFIDSNYEKLTNMWDEEPLKKDWLAGKNDWRTGFSVKDQTGNEYSIEQLILNYADVALTKYYDYVDGDNGIADDWCRYNDALNPEQKHALLGDVIKVNGLEFDPGGMGTYFQSREQALKSYEILKGLSYEELSAYVQLLAKVVENGKGVLVTF